jgi:hypothetical protein
MGEDHRFDAPAAEVRQAGKKRLLRRRVIDANKSFLEQCYETCARIVLGRDEFRLGSGPIKCFERLG